MYAPCLRACCSDEGSLEPSTEISWGQEVNQCDLTGVMLSREATSDVQLSVRKEKVWCVDCCGGFRTFAIPAEDAQTLKYEIAESE